MIDSYELSAASAIFTAKVKGRKRVKLKDIYDAEKARNDIESPILNGTSELNLERYKKAKDAMKGYQPKMK